MRYARASAPAGDAAAEAPRLRRRIRLRDGGNNGAGNKDAGNKEMTGSDKDSNADSMRAFGALGSVGLSFVIAIVLGVGGGLLIDRWIGDGHWGFFAGFFLGVAAGIVTVVRASKSIK